MTRLTDDGQPAKRPDDAEVLAPTVTANGAALKRFLLAHPPDSDWIDELRALREGLSGEARSLDDWSPEGPYLRR